jgi:hypothetical protein
VKMSVEQKSEAWEVLQSAIFKHNLGDTLDDWRAEVGFEHALFRLKERFGVLGEVEAVEKITLIQEEMKEEEGHVEAFGGCCNGECESCNGECESGAPQSIEACQSGGAVHMQEVEPAEVEPQGEVSPVLEVPPMLTYQPLFKS